MLLPIIFLIIDTVNVEKMEVGVIKITEEEQIVRKERIIHTAFHLFCEYGIDGVSMKDIAKTAQVGEKSLYRYFTTKAELTIATVALLWKEIVYELIASIDQNEYEKKNGLGQVECLLHCFTNLFELHSKYVVFSYDYKLFLMRHETFLTEDEYVDEIRPIQNMYLKALEKGIKDGSIAFHDDIEQLYYAIWGLIRGYIVKIVIYDKMYQGVNMWKNSYIQAYQIVVNGIKSAN